jgi:hypothetical protein
VGAGLLRYPLRARSSVSRAALTDVPHGVCGRRSGHRKSVCARFPAPPVKLVPRALALCSALLRSTLLYPALPAALLCSTLLCSALLCCSTLLFYCALLCSTLLDSALEN